MDEIQRLLYLAKQYGDRQSEFETHMDNLEGLGVTARGQTLSKHNAVMMAALRLGHAMGRLGDDV